MQGESVKVSVVVPVYNGEKYLRECLDSIVNQTLEDIEIICVDDGSKDSSVEIIQEYCKKYPKVKLIQQKNMYAGVARNNGIKNAKGKYLIFWDCDDFFHERALELMANQMDEDQADICVCNAVQYDCEKNEINRGVNYLNLKVLPEKKPFSWKDIPERIFNFTTDVPWNKMYSRDFVKKHNLEFQGIVRANDHYFVLSAAMLAERITYVNKELIYYRVSHTTSLTASLSASPLCTCQAFLAVKENLVKYNLWKNEDIRKSFANRCLNSLIYVLDKQRTYEAFANLYHNLKEETFEALGIEDKGKDYYYSEESYKILTQILECPEQEFMILHFQYYYAKCKDLERKLKKMNSNFLIRLMRKVYRMCKGVDIWK